jgi:RHS repeat-associated protein
VRAGSAAVPEAYAYDAAGNVLSMPGLGEGAALGASGYATAGGSEVVLDTGNRVYRANGEQFAYDERDHVSARMRWDGVTTRYGYDSLDRLVSVDAPGMAWRAKHDALGRRTEVACNGRVRRQYWDTDRLAAEHFDDGRVRVYVYPDAHALVPLLSVDYASREAAPESGVVHAWFTSHQGAPEEVTQLDGTLVWSARVAPFGTVEVTHGSEFHQPLRWPGHFYDADTGLHYNRFREYDPRLGRYLQSDPQGISGGDNLYAYAWDDNPLRSVDVRGLACPGEGGDGAEGEDGVEGEGTTPRIRPGPVVRGVSDEHIEMAARPGNSKAQVRARKLVAKRFYKQHGKIWDSEMNGGRGGMRNPSASEARAQLNGIDYTKPIVLGPPPEAPSMLSQWQRAGGRQGQFYAEDRTPPTQLGIYDKASDGAGGQVPKVAKSYEMNQDSQPYMKSTAAPIKDTWSVPESAYRAEGGGTQYYVPNTSSAKPL